MCRPINEIIAQLDERYKAYQIAPVEERSRTIDQYDSSMKYLLEAMGNYVKEAEYTLDNSLSNTILYRSTQNLILHISHTHSLLPQYENAILLYLMDERYDVNYCFWQEFKKTSRSIKSLVGELLENGVFSFEDIDKESIDNAVQIIYGSEGVGVERERAEKEIASLKEIELLYCLESMLVSMEDALTSFKMSELICGNDTLEKLYDINYLLYAKEYWHIEQKNLRAHITNKTLRNQVSISKLEEQRSNEIYEFEYHTTSGKIWRDYSEDGIVLASHLKTVIKTNNEWKQFFKTIFRIEEYDRWIEELRNPPESEEDKQKRIRLKESNRIFNLQPRNGRKNVDILLLYKYINERFLIEKEYEYDWYALYYLFKSEDIITDCDIDEFMTQMYHPEWFGANGTGYNTQEMRRYDFLAFKNPTEWNVVCSRTTKKSIPNRSNLYFSLEDTIDEIYKRQNSEEDRVKNIYVYGSYYDIHDNNNVNTNDKNNSYGR